MEIKIKNLTVIIIAKNEEKKIENCLKSISWAGEILLIDNGSTDKTAKIAKSFGTKIFSLKKANHAQLRNLGLEKATGNWILYIDADERATTDFEKELSSIINNKLSINYSAFAIPRRNIILRKEMKHGGWWPDYVKRVFLKKTLIKWDGELHEEPVISGKYGYFNSPLIHVKHDNFSEMVEKSNIWSEIEAKLLYEANHPKMALWRFLRIMISEIWYRLIVLKGFLDGPEGVIYAFYQMWYRFLVYAKLWEIQIQIKK